MEQRSAGRDSVKTGMAPFSCSASFESNVGVVCARDMLILCCPTLNGMRERIYQISSEGEGITLRNLSSDTRQLALSFEPEDEGGSQRNRTMLLDLAGDGRVVSARFGTVNCIEESPFDIFQIPETSGDSPSAWHSTAESFSFILRDVYAEGPEPNRTVGDIRGCIGSGIVFFGGR